MRTLEFPEDETCTTPVPEQISSDTLGLSEQDEVAPATESGSPSYPQVKTFFITWSPKTPVGQECADAILHCIRKMRGFEQMDAVTESMSGGNACKAHMHILVGFSEPKNPTSMKRSLKEVVKEWHTKEIDGTLYGKAMRIDTAYKNDREYLTKHENTIIHEQLVDIEHFMSGLPDKKTQEILQNFAKDRNPNTSFDALYKRYQEWRVGVADTDVTKYTTIQTWYLHEVFNGTTAWINDHKKRKPYLMNLYLYIKGKNDFDRGLTPNYHWDPLCLITESEGEKFTYSNKRRKII